MSDLVPDATQNLVLHVKHGLTSYDLTLPATSNIDQLKRQLYDLTSVPVENQKLLWKGIQRSATQLHEAGLKSGSRITLVGVSEDVLQSVHRAEAETARRTEIMRNREARGPTKVRDTSTPASSQAQYRFHRIEPLPNLPNPIQARSILTKLANDPAIVHIMRAHKFSVGLLTELAPHEHPGLLGLNVNAGQSILLRVRTDAYDGFRNYPELRRVLCHELTHNVYGGHADDFKTLNSQLNREVAEFERSVKAGTHVLSDAAGYEDRASNIEREAAVQAFVLGGGSSPQPTHASDSREERRQRILAATVSRLEQEEKEIEDRCGG